MLSLGGKGQRGVRDRGVYLMLKYLYKKDSGKKKRKGVILVCKLLIIQYLLINSYSSFAVNRSLESALTLLHPH